MKAKIFGGKKQSAETSSSGYHSPVPGHLRAPSPNYTPPAQGYQGSASQSTLERSPSLRQGHFGPGPRQTAESIDSGAGPTLQEQQRILENRNSQYYNQQQIPPISSPQALPEDKKKRGLREKIGFGHSSKSSEDRSSGRVGVGRTVSLSKKKEQRQADFFKETGIVGDPRLPYARQINSSQNLLNTHAEEDEESQHNIYDRQNFPPPPTVPVKDGGYEPRYEQPAPPQAYYQDPRSIAPLQTDHSIQQHIDPRSPVDQQHYYQSEGGHPQDSYHAYQPDEEGTPGTPYQTSPEDSQGRYSYTQPPGYGQHNRVVSGQAPQPELHYPQPIRTSSERYRPVSGGQLPPGYQEQQTEKQNPLFLKAPQRGNSTEQPPSPLVAAGPPSALQQGHEPHPPPSPQPPSTANSAQSSVEDMPAGNQVRGSTRDKATAGSRESSGMQTPPPVPPHKQGVSAYGTNMVPVGSQGAPYKGVAGQDKGRESPAPGQQAPVELVDEEASAYLQLQKEYRELKEKYQKVKKYYFEKEAQVHQLQNSLAHQRLSQSRTSLDDSEYAARFQRLDGLISQLSFSIRKSWKTVPDFLQRGVNKDALVTGKQEMTAVGKAYMSHWLVANLFDMYFHPQLELGLSRDLKEVMINVRRYCPPFQSGEEEEALTAKLINWRLTTIDGLQDRLKAPEAQEHHAKLVEMLNQKMVGDMSLLLTDPAPPDLQGGISMIIDLAVAVAMHLPMESREVSVEYYGPGAPIMPEMMKVETGIPALTAPIATSETSPSSDAAERASLKSTDTRESNADGRDSSEQQSREEKKARGILGGLMSGNTGAKVAKPPPAGMSQQQPRPAAGRETPVKEERVRMSVGIGVMVRGKSVLAKASVYTMGV